MFGARLESPPNGEESPKTTALPMQTRSASPVVLLLGASALTTEMHCARATHDGETREAIASRGSRTTEIGRQQERRVRILALLPQTIDRELLP